MITLIRNAKKKSIFIQEWGKETTTNTKYIAVSLIQWNDEYAVSVKHGGIGKNPEYTSENYDLIFFKNKPNRFYDKAVTFRSPYVNEKVKHVGFVNKTTISRFGNVLDQKGSLEKVEYSLTNASTMTGMSGGPIYSEDNKSIVGMSTHKTNNITIDGKIESNIALFIQANVIQDEWNKFIDKNN